MPLEEERRAASPLVARSCRTGMSAPTVAIGGNSDTTPIAPIGRELTQCIRPLIGAFAPGHHGYQRACVLISGQASTGHSGHQCSHAPGRPILHLYLFLSQTSAGNG